MRRIGKTAWFAGLSVLAIAVGTAGAMAADMGKAIEYRQNLMKSIGGNAADITLMLKGEVPFSAEQVAAHATAINALAKIIPDAVPAGSGPEAGKTYAKPEIWQKMDDFKAHANTLVTESAKLIQVAKSGDQAAIGKQVGVMGKEGCGGCHQTYRTPLK
jgi:cytochrome c556